MRESNLKPILDMSSWRFAICDDTEPWTHQAVVKPERLPEAHHNKEMDRQQTPAAGWQD